MLVVHPSPVDTGFYAGNKHGVDAMAMFQKTATSPESVAACFFKSAGRFAVHDQGYFCVCLRMLLKCIDNYALATIFTYAAHTSGDFIKLRTAATKAKDAKAK